MKSDEKSLEIIKSRKIMKIMKMIEDDHNSEHYEKSKVMKNDVEDDVENR